ncbi:MAG: hypothetical protein BWY60_00180 [Actinobacteria bacterium ADurb.Bin346]|nr:MAG: hypothetical protein BWY60_00180 [Actinobacteria bacterium ADurb.Bin346]
MNFTLYTIGHSTRTIEEFIKLLEIYKIKIVIDIRTVPRSRHNPQFSKDELIEGLKKHGISYRHMEGLGGLRHTTKDSVNKAWKNLTFRGYADYMQTEEFAKNIEELIKIGREKQTVIMCAEAVPWRCHRSLIGDALLLRGVHVEDIMSEKVSKPHKLTSFAKVEGNTITYP